MTSGIKVFSESGSLQIDSDYFNMFLVRKVDYDVPIGGAALSLANQSGEIICFNLDGTYKYLTTTYVDSGVGVVGQGTAYIFKTRPPSKLQAGEVGFEVYKSDGSVAFSSKDKPLNIIGSLRTTESKGSYQLPHSRVGVIPITPSVTMATVGAGGPAPMTFIHYAAGMLDVGNVFRWENRMKSNGYHMPARQFRNLHLLFVDLTYL